MNLNQTDAPAKFKSMRIIFFAMIAGLLAFTAVAFNITKASHFFKPDHSDILFIPCFLLTLISVFAGFYVSGISLRKIGTEETLNDKLMKYQSVLVPRLATCEGAALFSIVCFLLSSNLIYVLFEGIALIVMAYHYPSVAKTGAELGLNDSEINDLIS